MAKASDLQKLSYTQLAELRTKIDALMADKKAQQVEKMKASITAQIEQAGLSVDDIWGQRKETRGAPKGAKVAVKYKNPLNPSETWTGRGRTPRWMQQAMNKGAKQESFLIK